MVKTNTNYDRLYNGVLGKKVFIISGKSHYNFLNKIYEKKDQAYVENVNIFKKIQKLFCSKNLILDKKFTVYMQKKDIDLNIEFLTFDKRHFKSNLVNLTSIDNLC